MSEKPNELRQFSDDECPDDFYDVLVQGGSLVIECTPCGRVHFASEGDYDQGEYEGLRLQALENPEQYIERDDFTSWGHAFGKQVVADCPCGYAAHIAEVAWSNRTWLLPYFDKRSKRELAEAQGTRDEVTAALPRGP